MRQAKPLSIIEVLQKVNDGGALEDLKENIQKCARLVEERGGQGSVTLTLTFKKMARKQLTIVDSVKLSEPKKVNDPTIFFVASEDGDLSRNNPDQFAMEDIKNND